MSCNSRVPRAKVTETTRELPGLQGDRHQCAEVPVEEVIRQLFGERRTGADPPQSIPVNGRQLAAKKRFLNW